MERKDPYFRDVKSFYPPTGGIFKRRGAWFGISVTANGYGMSAVHLSTLHGGSARARDGSKLIDFCPTYQGRKVPFVVQRLADELVLLTRYGSVRFTFGSPTLLMAQGDEGMGLCFEKNMEQHETVKPRANGAWEAAFRWTCSVVFQGLEDSAIRFGNCWDWPKLSSGRSRGIRWRDRTAPSPWPWRNSPTQPIPGSCTPATPRPRRICGRTGRAFLPPCRNSSSPTSRGEYGRSTPSGPSSPPPPPASTIP